MPTCFISQYFCINLNKSRIYVLFLLHKSMYLHILSWQIGAELVRTMGIIIQETVFAMTYFIETEPTEKRVPKR